MRKQFFLPLQRFVSFVLVLVLMFSFCSTAICAQEAFAVLPIEINDTIYYVNVRLINNTLYCRADQWSQAANCLWKLNTNQNTVYLYYETPVILASYNQQEYVVEGDIVWIPFFDAATATGVYFTEVSGDAVHGHRAKPLAVFYGEEYYTITPLEDGGDHFDEPAESEPQAWEGEGTYAYSLVSPPYFEGNYISVYLRHPYRDIETAMNEMNNAGPRLAGICGEDNEYAGEIYSVEYVDSIVDAGDGCIYMYTRTVDGSALNIYTIESDGYFSVENDTDAWSGWGIKLCWFEPTYLELSSNCLFGDDRIDMTFEEMQHVFDQGYAQWGEFTEVNVTVRGGKITEFILPYAP